MQRLKNIAMVSAAILVLLQPLVQPCNARTLRIGYFNLPPHMYLSEADGKASGAAIRYLEKIADVMEYTLEWVGPLPYSRMMYYLENDGPLEGSPVMSLNAERQRFLSYPRNHFYLAKPNFVVRSDHPLESITSPEDVKGFVVGQFEKAANSTFVLQNRDLLRFEIVSTGNLLFEQQLKKLISGRIDAIHTLDEYTLLFEAKRLQQDRMIKILFLPEPAWPFYTAFSISRNGAALAREFDRAFDRAGYRPEDYHDLIREEFARIASP